MKINIELLIAYVIIVAGLLSVIYVMWGGIKFIMSHGKEQKKEEAINTIKYALIGLLITVFAVVIIQFVGQVVGIDVVQYLNFDEIVGNIRSIGGRSGDSINTLN